MQTRLTGHRSDVVITEEVTISEHLNGDVTPVPVEVLRLRAFLQITGGMELNRRYYLEYRDHFIGRSGEVDITLVDESISRLHAKVIWRNDDFIIVDLNSKNGTFLNGTAVHECPLRSGDTVQIGKHSLQFLFEAVPPS